MYAHDPKFMLCSALQGLDSARLRFLAAATPSTQPEDVFVPLTEALWWAVSVDEGFEALAGAGVSRYRDARNRDPCGRVLLPLRFARHRSGHQRALIAAEDALRLPFYFPVTLGVFFRWLPSTELPPIPAKHRKKNHAELQKQYDDTLAGRPAQEALESAANWFEQEQARAGL